MSGEGTSRDGWPRSRSELGRRRRHRARRHHRLGPGFASAPTLSPAGDAPSLGFPEPVTSRAAILSGSFSLGAHGLIVGLLVLSARLAPDVAEHLIPVQIIHEAPTPPPRRVVVPRRAVARTRVRSVAPRPTPVARPPVRPVAPRAVQPANINATAAPTEITQRQVTSQRVVAQRTLSSPGASALKVAKVPVGNVAARDLTAPTLDLSGPRTIAPAEDVDVTAPQVFREYTETANIQYTDAATVTAADIDVPFADTGFALDAELVDGARSYGTPDGTGTAGIAAPCMQRESVVRYYKDHVEKRTRAEWRHFELPEGIEADARVVLHFVLDESGSASAVEVVDAPSRALGESCKQALVAAAPFPSMEADVRCLAGRKLSGTFTVPVERTP
ncbi:MAG: hypothetical protein VX681_07930 [Myxococcota bacterium]|nr:hypothetical protein [Myxococcota bacterium]